MTKREQYYAAFSGVRARENLPTKVEDLIKPDVPRLFMRHGENKEQMIKALFGLRGIPEALIVVAEQARYDSAWNKEKSPGMRTTRELRWHTPTAQRQRYEAENKRRVRREQQDCAARGCEECSKALLQPS